MANFIGVLVLAAIAGAIFGSTGFWIMAIIGIIGMMGSAKNGAANNKGQAPASAPTPMQRPAIAIQQAVGPRPDQLAEYASSVVDLFSTILGYLADGHHEIVKALTDSLKSDDWILDKFSVLQDLGKQLAAKQVDRRGSSILFHIQKSADVERIRRMPVPMRLRMLEHVDALMITVGTSSPPDLTEFVAELKTAVSADAPDLRRKLEAEELIYRSGDNQAISTLREMQQNPRNYRKLLSQGAGGNVILKTALGVFAGIIAADVVRAAVTNYQIQRLVDGLDHEINLAGGLDSVATSNAVLEPFDTYQGISSDVGSLSHETSDAIAWNNETAAVTSDIDDSAYAEDAPQYDSGAYDSSSSSIFTDSPDSGSSSFSFDD